jgi:hypothetical protein
MTGAPMSGARNGWHPTGFERYRELYPRTPALAPEPDRAATARFCALWEGGRPAAARVLAERAARTTVVFVRGYLGHYMPGNLTAAVAAARQLGFDACRGRNRPGGTVGGNVRALARQLSTRPLRKRLLFCAHSRGGLECLTLLAEDRELAARCDGVVLAQTPRGPSRVMESILLGRHRDERCGLRRRATEHLHHAALFCLRAVAGGYELTSDRWPGLVAPIVDRAWPFPVLQTASWSSRPTAWLDSFHGRLGEIGPERAHDGQFFLDDLIWPRWPHLLLPDVDHAQPVVGGHGFDPARFWLAALAVLLDPASPCQIPEPGGAA